MKCPHCGEPFDVLDIEFDYYSRTVRSGGRTVRLADNELHLLEFLIDAHPRPVGMQTIYEGLYTDCGPDELPGLSAVQARLTRCIKALRKANFPFQIARISVGLEGGYTLLEREKIEAAATAA